MKAVLFIGFAALFVAFAFSDEETCPEEDGKQVTLLPNPHNCSTFFMCLAGSKIEMVCPDGLEFNNKLKVCDRPHSADCHEVPLF